MRKLIVSSALLAVALCAAAPSAHAQLKLGTVDMNAVFTSYYKTKEAETKINETRVEAKKDLDSRIEVLKQKMEAINKLNKEVEKPELSKDGKDKIVKELNEKAQEARALDKEIGEFRGTKEGQLREQFLRMRKDIIDDIMVVVNEKVKTAGYDLVLDKSGASMGQIPIVLYSRNDVDFSNEVITTLNKNAPKAPSAAN